MPEVLVTTAAEEDNEVILLRERVRSSDFETEHFRRQLAERIGWAVADAELSEAARDESSPAGATVERAPGGFGHEDPETIALAQG